MSPSSQFFAPLPFYDIEWSCGGGGGDGPLRLALLIAMMFPRSLPMAAWFSILLF